MKLLFKCTGWILFAFISFLLIIEYSHFNEDNTLFYHQPGGYQMMPIRYVSPIIISILYLFALIANVASIFRKKDYLVTNISNFILAIPIFIAQYPLTKIFLLFGWFSYNHKILEFLLFSYLSFIFLILLAFYLTFHFVKRSRSADIEPPPTVGENVQHLSSII